MTAPRVIEPGQISLASGGVFDFRAPWRSDFTIEDVAGRLSKLCRFAGGVGRFYSVAEHSVHVSGRVPPALALAGLLHDAHEAFTGDLIAPLKLLCPDFRRIEDCAAAVVRRRFGLPADLPPEVKGADLALLMAEKVQAVGTLDAWPEDAIPPAAVRLQFWPPALAERAFLSRFTALAGAG